MEQDHLQSQPNSHGSPRRRRTRDDLSAPSDNVLARDPTLGRAEVAQGQQNGTRNSLPGHGIDSRILHGSLSRLDIRRLQS